MTLNTSCWWRARPLQVQVAACRLGSARPGFQKEGSCLWVWLFKTLPSSKNIFTFRKRCQSIELVVFDPLELRDLFHVQSPLVAEAEGFSLIQSDVDLLQKITNGNFYYRKSQMITLPLGSCLTIPITTLQLVNVKGISTSGATIWYLDITAPLLLYLRFVQLFSLSLFYSMWYET